MHDFLFSFLPPTIHFSHYTWILFQILQPTVNFFSFDKMEHICLSFIWGFQREGNYVQEFSNKWKLNSLNLLLVPSRMLIDQNQFNMVIMPSLIYLLVACINPCCYLNTWYFIEAQTCAALWNKCLETGASKNVWNDCLIK